MTNTSAIEVTTENREPQNTGLHNVETYPVSTTPVERSQTQRMVAALNRMQTDPAFLAWVSKQVT
jgi:hypothetical protein